MSKKTEKAPSDSGSDTVVITAAHIKMIESLIINMNRIKLDQEALADDVKAVAAQMNMKPAGVKEIAGWIMKEQEKGGVLDEKEKKIDLVRKVLSKISGEEE